MVVSLTTISNNVIVDIVDIVWIIVVVDVAMGVWTIETTVTVTEEAGGGGRWDG